MKEKTIKVLIISIMILLIIGLIVLLIIINKSKNKNSTDIEYELEDAEFDSLSEEFLEEADNSITLIEMIKVNNCVQTFLDVINKNNSIYYERTQNGDYNKIIDEEKIKEKILVLLDEQYIEENNININNIYSFIDNIEEKVIFDLIDIKKANVENKYIVYGIIQNLENELIKREYFIVNIQNNCYSIQPVLKKTIDEAKIKKTNVIESQYNEINTINIRNTEDIIKFYFDLYKKLLLVSAEDAFIKLNEEYREKRFNNDLGQFEKFIKLKSEQLNTINISRYLEKNTGNITRYICIDQYNNYYIIEITGNSRYSIFLDTYTIDTPEFTEKYDKANDQQKIGMNIEKIVSAINCKDYEYIYSKFDETFKSNNFQNVSQLEEVLKKNLFDVNKVTYEKFTKIGDDIYTYNIILYNPEQETSQKMTIVMKLLENRDFVMSFSFD